MTVLYYSMVVAFILCLATKRTQSFRPAVLQTGVIRGIKSTRDGTDWQDVPKRSSRPVPSSGNSGDTEKRSYPRRPIESSGRTDRDRFARPQAPRYSEDRHEREEGATRALERREEIELPRRDSYRNSSPLPRTSSPYGGRENYNRYNRDLRTQDDREYESRQPSPLWDYDGDHLYGISTIRAALVAQRRNITELLVQDGLDVTNKKDEKGASEILSLAAKFNIPIKEYSKHDLNMLSENRPHQGFVLRAHPLQFRRLDAGLPKSEAYKVILALDEVWDPQNFGALLRTGLFLGVDGVVVCSKNSAPLSPTVSKASSGAMEVMEVSSTENMMKFVDKSIENGWQVVGAALDPASLGLQELPLDKPTILVLGNEGSGIRTNILRRCTHLVRISGGTDTEAVDSLNVSVTGGILMHHLLSQKHAK